MQESQYPLEIQAQLDRLEAVLIDALSNYEDSSTRKLVFFIRRTLRQFHLESRYDECQIVIDTYLRAIKLTETGTIAQNLPAWLNRISYNIIREYSRRERQQRKLTNRLRQNGSELGETRVAPDSEDIDIDKIQILWEAFNKLSEEEQEILNLRIVKALSWKKVSDELNISISTARKRGERSLKRLRRSFFSIDRAKASERGR